MDEGEVRELYNPKSSLKLRLLPSRLVAAFQAKVFNELCCSSVCFLFHTSSLFLRFPLHSTPTQRDSTQLYSPRCGAPVKCGDDDDVDDALDRSQQQNRKWRQGQGKHRVAEGKWEGYGVGSACQATLSITNLALITYSTTPKSMACPGGPNLVGLAGLSRPQGILVKANCRLLIRSWLLLLLSLSLTYPIALSLALSPLPCLVTLRNSPLPLNLASLVCTDCIQMNSD